MTTNILILCTHNSARSLLAESMLNHWAKALGREVRAYSAGSAPSGRPNPFALAVLKDVGIDIGSCRSKSWDEFALAEAPRMSAVITVCDNAAGESCPIWPGSPVQVHWGYDDPSNTAGGEAEKQAAFELTRQAIGYRMLQLLNLPFAQLSQSELLAAMRTIGSS